MKLISIEYFLDNLEEMWNARDNIPEECEDARMIILRSNLARFVMDRVIEDVSGVAKYLSRYTVLLTSKGLYEKMKEDGKKFINPEFEDFVNSKQDDTFKLLDTLEGIEDIKEWMRKTFTCIIFTSSLKRRRDEAETD